MGRLASHLQRLRRQIGEPVRIGSRRYRVRGYLANNLAIELGHEPHVAAAIYRILAKRRGAFIDIGANLGQTLANVLAADPSRPYVGFEPQIACCHFIDQFVKDNGVSNACVLPVALSDRNGTLTLYSSNAVDDQASLTGVLRPDGQLRSIRTLVPTRVGDEVMTELGLSEIAAIKIDVEGAEVDVLRGLRQTLGSKRPDILFELLPNFYGRERTFRDAAACEKNRAFAAALGEFFNDVGYRVRQVSVNGEAPIERFALDDAVSYVGADYIATASV